MDMNDPQWQKLMDDILSGMKEWRKQNPKATFAEIERETMKRMSELQARLMEDLAQASEAANWAGESAPDCPSCGTRMEKRGKRERHLQSQGGQDVKLERAYAVCPKCGAGFFPPG